MSACILVSTKFPYSLLYTHQTSYAMSMCSTKIKMLPFTAIHLHVHSVKPTQRTCSIDNSSHCCLCFLVILQRLACSLQSNEIILVLISSYNVPLQQFMRHIMWCISYKFLGLSLISIVLQSQSRWTPLAIQDDWGEYHTLYAVASDNNVRSYTNSLVIYPPI